MKFYKLVSTVLFICITIVGCSSETSEAQTEEKSASILIFTKTEGFRHQSIPTGAEAVSEIAADNGMTTLHTENADYFQPDSLANFDVVLFLNTTGNILNDQQQEAFEQFIQNGGGFVGIHAAADTEYEWPWYGDLVGAYFESHPQIQEATITVLDKTHPATSFLPDEWVRTDEWYNYKDINPDINVLMNLEESTYEGGKNGENHPTAWYHEFDGGRAFYTGSGHTEESYSEPEFRKHVLGGINYVLGE
jgi:type 1 glutamine amidotransferase